MPKRSLWVGDKKLEKNYVLEKLRQREVSINKAAELAGVTFSDMLDLMEKENIDIGYALNDLEKDIAKIKGR